VRNLLSREIFIPFSFSSSFTIAFVRLLSSSAFANSQMKTPNNAKKIPRPIGPDQNNIRNSSSIFHSFHQVLIVNHSLLSESARAYLISNRAISSDEYEHYQLLLVLKPRPQQCCSIRQIGCKRLNLTICTLIEGYGYLGIKPYIPLSFFIRRI